MSGRITEQNGIYTPGGRNVMAARYDSGGSFQYEERARWVGTLDADWYGAGVCYGKKLADMILASTDYWWKTMCRFKGTEETRKAVRNYLEQVEWLDPAQTEYLKGITAGAAELLERSEYNKQDNEFYEEPFFRVFAASICDCWLWGDPDAYKDPDAKPNTYAEEYICGKVTCGGCNSVAVLGNSTRYGKTITSQIRHTMQAGFCYQAALSFHSPENEFHDFWTMGNAPSTNGLLLVNDQGVSISHHFGGATTAESLQHGCYGGAYGVPWPNMVFYAIKHASTAAEAIDLLIHGSPEYREKSGRNTVLRDGAWNWMVCDKDTVAVLEVSPDRYAVRYPGEYTGEWKQKEFIVCANHFLCDHSYDENDKLTDIPMTVFNANPTSEKRFWTLMWEMKDFYKNSDIYSLQYIFSQQYLRDRETGEYQYVMQDEEGRYTTSGQAFGCVQGTLADNGLTNGTNGSKIAILDGAKSSCYFSLGNPKDWAGEWDNFTFDIHQTR